MILKAHAKIIGQSALHNLSSEIKLDQESLVNLPGVGLMFLFFNFYMIKLHA